MLSRFYTLFRHVARLRRCDNSRTPKKSISRLEKILTIEEIIGCDIREIQRVAQRSGCVLLPTARAQVRPPLLTQTKGVKKCWQWIKPRKIRLKSLGCCTQQQSVLGPGHQSCVARIGRLSHYGLRVADPHLVGNNKARKFFFFYIPYDFFFLSNLFLLQH